jgi:hypothetical protein
MMTKALNRQQAHLTQELASIDFEICYHPASQNAMLDALLQCSEYPPSNGGSEEQAIQTVRQDNHFEDKKWLNSNKEEVIFAITKLPYKRWINWNKEFLEEVKTEGTKDEQYLEALQSLGKEDDKMESSVHQDEGVLYRKLKLWVPCDLRDSLLHSEPDLKVAGHIGQDKMMELIRQNVC